MKLSRLLLAAAITIGVGAGAAFGSGLWSSSLPEAESANITNDNCIPVDVFGPSVADSQGRNPQTVCAKPSDISNFIMPPKPLIGYTTIPIGAVALGSIGTSTTPTAGTTYWSNIDIPVSYEITSLTCLNGATAATDLLLYSLYDSTGALVANTALAGTLAANADTFQTIALTEPYTITPGRYWIGWQTNGTTTRVETIPAATYVNVLTTSSTGTFGTIEEPTIPTTFTADVGPICGVVD